MYVMHCDRCNTQEVSKRGIRLEQKNGEIWNDPRKIGSHLDFCDACSELFRKWLKEGRPATD